MHIGKLSAGKAWLIKKIPTIKKVFPFSHLAMTSMHPLLSSPTRFLIASVIACMLAGCGDANRAKIVGTWGIEQADTVMSRINRSDSPTDDQYGELETNPGPPKMVLKFLRSGMLETSTNMGAVGQQKQGTWKMVAFDEATNQMTILCDIKNQESEHEVEFLDQETIKLVPPNMAGTKMKIKFKRQH